MSNTKFSPTEALMIAMNKTVRHQPATSASTLATIDSLHALRETVIDLATACNVEWDGEVSGFAYKTSDVEVKPELVLAQLAQLDLQLHKLYLTYGLSRYADAAFMEAYNSEMSAACALAQPRPANYAAVLATKPDSIFS